MSESGCNVVDDRRWTARSLRSPGLLRALSVLAVASAFRGGHARALAEDCVEIGDALTEHACFHAERGPFRTVRADGFENVPNVNASHTHYTVQVGAEGGRVTYRPTRGGSWVLLTDVDAPIAITSEGG
jgi:hypothetical protein